MNNARGIADMPVVRDLKDFDLQSGNLLERLVFNHRKWVLLLCALLTLLFAACAVTRLSVQPSFEKMIPQNHPYIRNFLANRNGLSGMGNAVRVVVESTDGNLFDVKYLDTLRQINDELFLTPGVDRAWMKSLWTPTVRWTEVTEEGFSGGPVMPDGYDGTPAMTEQLKANIARSSTAQNLVASNQKSSMISVPLLDHDPVSGKRLDYRALCKSLEAIRAKYEKSGNGHIRIHIIGFAKMVGDLVDGLIQVMLYFAIAALIAAGIIYGYTRCLRSTALVIGCSIVAVLWQLGLVSVLGFELDPYSILVPFLIFAIGVSHGAQKMNGIMQDVGRGTHRLVAARYTFRRLFLAGVTALVADAVGFAVLMVVDIPVIRDLAITASVGVAILVLTNLLLLPVLLSYFGVSAVAAQRAIQQERETSEGHGVGGLWNVLNHFSERRWALLALAAAAVLSGAGYYVSRGLQIGDLDPGAPELRPDSRYNRDNAYVTGNYRLSSDVFAVIVKTPAEGCLKYQTLIEADQLAWQLQQVPGVQTSVSLADAVRQITAGSYEGSSKWLTLSRNQDTLNYAAQQASVNSADLFNVECSLMLVLAYLGDHKAATLERVAAVAETFAKTHSQPDRQFLLAAGNAGIEAATNSVVKDANRKMLFYVYGAVCLLCFITFRSWRAVIVAVVPLMMTSILCEALMVWLGIGVKVATLPVIALGVGIGVDYALYLLSVQLAQQRQGVPLREAYQHAVQFTGKVVGLVGVTLAAGVIIWAFSPIKFQADMGILLTFMFVWNMVGALVLIPALSWLLLRDVGANERQLQSAAVAR